MRILETGVLVLKILDLLDEIVVSLHLLVKSRPQLDIFSAECALLLTAVELFLSGPFELTSRHKIPGVVSAVVVSSPIAPFIMVLAWVVVRQMMEYLLIDIFDLFKGLSVHALLAGHQLNGLIYALAGFG